MLSLTTNGINRLGAMPRFDRRELLRIGALGLGGLTLPNLLRLTRASERNAGMAIRPRAKSVIVLFLSGGPAQMDMFDPKPDAPSEVRGPFEPIATNQPGLFLTEHLPQMARIADRFAVIRSMQHRQSNHPAAAYWMMIGHPIARPVADSGFMSRSDRPHPGSVLARVLGPNRGIPPFVLLPEAMQPNGPERSGQFAGFLGAAYDPYRINSDPNEPDYSPGAVALPEDVPGERLILRRSLREALEDESDRLARSRGVTGMDESYERAFAMLSSVAARRAFDIAEEPAAVRDRYGRHVFGQSVLLARRMVEAGVRLVQVNWVRHDGGKGGAGYDTHRNHFEWSRTQLLPPTDAAFTALIEDLHDRRLLDETLVIMMGEFGRTPRVNKDGGRDHWPYCFSVVVAGGGIQGGRILGASDRLAAYPATEPVSPGDLIATLYHCLGVDPHLTIHDQQDRPYSLSDGQPLQALL